MSLLLAHGLLDPDALPVPLPLLLWGAGGVVLGSAALLGRRGRTAPRWRATALPAVLTRVVDHPVTRALLRLVGLAVLLGIIVTAAFGPDADAVNPAPRLLYVVVWGGLAIVSFLLGPVWRLLNPLRGVSRLLARLAGDPAEEGVRPLPAAVGYRPAAAGLALIAWGDLVLPHSPLLVLLLLGILVLVQLGAASVYGSAWYARGDPLEVLSSVLGRLAPFGRVGPGDGPVESGPVSGQGAVRFLGLRNPRQGVAGLTVEPGLLAVLAVLIGAALYDAFALSPAWYNQRLELSDGVRLLVDTAALAACIALAYGLGRLTARLPRLVLAFVPLAAGYVFLHHFGVLFIDGQVVVAQLSDPFDTGRNLFGTAGRPADPEIISATFASVLQLLVFLGAHLLAVVVAHDAATDALPPRRAQAAQLGLRALLAASAVGGAWLMFSGV